MNDLRFEQKSEFYDKGLANKLKVENSFDKRQVSFSENLVPSNFDFKQKNDNEENSTENPESPQKDQEHPDNHVY